MYYRLIKPTWGKPQLNGQPNPAFIREIVGPNTFEGYFDSNEIHQKNTKGYNIYFFPNYPSQVPNNIKFINGKHIDTFEYVFVDMDLKDRVYVSKEEFLEYLNQFPVTPTRTVDSGNGIHVYWKLSNLTRMDYMALQFSLIDYFDTDTSVWTPLQLMRVPGYTNTKDPGNLKMATILNDFSSENEYSVEELASHLKPPSERALKKIEKHEQKLNGEYLPVMLDADPKELPSRFQKLLNVWGLFSDPVGTYGERSGADMSLCNSMYDLGFSKREARAVLHQTKKALERPDKEDYVYNILDIVYNDRNTESIPSVREWLKLNKVTKNEPVRGPAMFDDFGRGWSKGDVLGIVAGTGIGKTSYSLSMVKGLIDNNPSNDDIYFFFTLEMSEKEIVKRWLTLVGDEDKYQDRFFVFGNDNAKQRTGPQQIYRKVKQTCRRLGKETGAIVIDHFQSLSKTIDTIVNPNFSVEADQNAGKGRYRTADIQTMCRIIKDLAQKLNCFLIVQNQTTKEKGGIGDKPLDVSAAYGAAQFEWYCDFLMTVWQPISTMQSQTDLCITAFQYCKIREKDIADKIFCNERHSLFYDKSTGNLRSLSTEEEVEFKNLLPMVRAQRKLDAKGENDNYINRITEEDKAKMDMVFNKRYGKGTLGNATKKL